MSIEKDIKNVALSLLRTCKTILTGVCDGTCGPGPLQILSKSAFDSVKQIETICVNYKGSLGAGNSMASLEQYVSQLKSNIVQMTQKAQILTTPEGHTDPQVRDEVVKLSTNIAAAIKSAMEASATLAAITSLKDSNPGQSETQAKQPASPVTIELPTPKNTEISSKKKVVPS